MHQPRVPFAVYTLLRVCVCDSLSLSLSSPSLPLSLSLLNTETLPNQETRCINRECHLLYILFYVPLTCPAAKFCFLPTVVSHQRFAEGMWGRGGGRGGRERENVSVALLKTLTPGPCVSATQSTFYFPDIPCAITCARAALDLTDIEL